MTIVEGSLLLWFAKFGHLEFRQMNSIEDAIELVVRLNDQSTPSYEYDEYGSPDALERVGSGIVEDFFDQCEAREKQLAREREAAHREYAARKKANPGPWYNVELSPPKGLSPHLSRYPEALASGLGHDDALAERDRLEALFGRDRIKVTRSGVQP